MLFRSFLNDSQITSELRCSTSPRWYTSPSVSPLPLWSALPRILSYQTFITQLLIGPERNKYPSIILLPNPRVYKNPGPHVIAIINIYVEHDFRLLGSKRTKATVGNKMLDPTKQTSFMAVRIDIDMMEIGPRVIETAL